MNKKSKENGVQLPFNHDGFIEKWQEWLQYRKERRLPNYVPTGLKGTFTRLKNMSNDNPLVAIEIIQQSMDNNYQGLFPLKTLSNGTTHTRFIKDKPEPTGNVVTGGFGQL